MPLRKLLESSNYAISGILYAAKTQRHMRYHLYAAVLVLMFSLIVGVKPYEFIAIAILVTIVISAEMLNTAVELIVDILFEEYDQRAKAIKDVAAGAVFITALGSTIVGYVILYRPVRQLFYSGMDIVKHSGDDIAVISLIVVLIMVVITKSFFKKGSPLRGGLPSGHSAIAFSMWTAVTLLTGSFIPSFLVLILAVMVAQSRISVGIHNPWEVILGSLLGTIVTFLMFKLFLP